MKRQYLLKATLCLFVFITTFPGVFSQALTTNWPLTASLVATAGSNLTTTGADAALGASMANGGYSSSGVKTTSSVVWPATATDGFHIDFPMTVSSGNQLVIATTNLLTFSMKTSSGSGTSAAIVKYSINGSAYADFSSTTISTTSSTTLNYSSGPSSNITVGSGQTITFRVYLYGGANTSRVVYIKGFTPSGTVSASAATPTLTASSTSLTGFTFVSGSGPSAAQSFTVSGSNLTAGTITLNAPSGYEICTSSGGTYGATATITAAAGTLAATPIYVKLKASNTVGVYGTVGTPVTITMSGAGVTTGPTVGLSGTVTSGALTPLTAPVATVAGSITSTGFTANWGVVPNASGGYIVNVYNAASLVTTVPISGQSSTSGVITGLSASTAYTYKVVAVGDGLTYSNSVESSAISVTTIATPVASICDYPLYSSDFTDWDSMDQSSANASDPFAGGGAGAGFTLSAKPKVVNNLEPAIGLGETGYVVAYNGSGTLLKSKPLTFVQGGSVVLYVYNTSTSDRDFSLTIDGSSTGISATYEMLKPIGETESVAAVISGNNFKTGKYKPGGTGSEVRTILYKVTFTLPASLTGAHTLEIYDSGGLQGLAFTRFTVCSGVGTSPLITVNPPADQDRTFDGIANGADVVVNNTVKGFNLTGDVTASIVSQAGCTDVNRFALATPTVLIPKAQALSGISLPIIYTPSSVISSHCAMLQLTSPGATTVLVPLNGVSGSTGPVITTPATSVLLAAQLISPVTTTIDVSGINLTGPVTLTLSGTDAGQFKVLASSVSVSDATTGSGKTVTIQYTGGFSAPQTHSATLTLSSPGAVDVVIPLTGKTYFAPPTLYTLTTAVSPAGSGFVRANPAGPSYPSGTVVALTAVAERGYKFLKWGDVTNISTSRQITMTSNKSVTAYFELSPDGGAVGNLEAYYPTSITSNSLAVSWSTVTGASSYDVTLYDKDGAVVEVKTVSVTNCTFNVANANGVYSYRVVANTGDASDISGPYLLKNPTFSCGQ